jgi:signal transduction histidine kinase
MIKAISQSLIINLCFPMRSLRFKLIFTFLIISISGTALTTLIVRSSNEQAVDDLLRQQGQSEMIASALVYYENNGSWRGAEQALRDQTESGEPLPFALTDEHGRTIIPNRQFSPDSIVSPQDLANGIALEVDGKRVGTILTDNLPPPRDPAEEEFAAQTNRALLFGALGGTAVAILLAVILARTLTRPLRELSLASQQVAEGQLRQTVPVRTQDELGELAAAFNQMSGALDEANQARRQMTADIAHDLRTPLTVLSGYLEAMQDGTLAPTPARFELMQQEIDTLNRLVTDLRTLSLADAGKLVLQPEPTAPADLLSQVQATYGRQAEQQSITLEVKCATDLPPVNLDPGRMRQMLGNLVSNALRYTPAGGSITLAAQITANRLQITVIDTGPGIPAADLPHIFNRFYRGDKARSDESSGSGLGLAIAKSLVNAHGGTITADSPIANGHGTRFTITIPS